MPRPINQAVLDRLRDTHPHSPSVILWRIVAEETTTATRPLYAVNDRQPVTHAGKTYYPFPVGFSSYDEEGDGSLPTTILTVGNARGELSKQLHMGQGFIGQKAQGVMIPRDMVGADNSTAIFAVRWEIADATLTLDAITFQLESPNYFDLRSPQQRFIAANCRHRFGYKGCPYLLGPGGAYQACNKRVSDCRLRGNDMVSRGHPRLMPRQHGGFPGLPRRS